MPRTGRILVPEYPHHILQRGHNKQVVFADSQDFSFYLSNLEELKYQFDIQVHAYCLMTNHVHLLLNPGKKTSNLSKLMKTLAARTTRYRNRLENRTGTLWESRYKSSPVQNDEYLLTCCKYIELNPVRARMVDHPGNYVWSSYNQRIGNNSSNNWIDFDPAFLSLGGSDALRTGAYTKFVTDSLTNSELEFIRGAIQRGQLTGNNRFVDEVEEIIGIRVEQRMRGRPRK